MNSARLTERDPSWLYTKHRPVGPAPSLSPLEPPMEG